jgi:twinkle protein
MADGSRPIRKEPCPKCGSRDNLVRYDDGHAYCYGMGCGHHEQGDGSSNDTPQRGRRMATDLIQGGDLSALTKRGVTEETCRKFGYRTARFNDRPVQIAPYYDADGMMVAQKVRFPDKTFMIAGDLKEAGLFGAQLWGQGGRKIVITEGEIDAMSVSQVQGNKWPVVSVPNGAQGAKKAIAKSLDWLTSFEEVILMFDQDGPGREAMAECAPLFPPGKCKLASLPMKDPNELLMAGRGEEIVNAVWQAKTWRPDGILNGADIWHIVDAEDATVSQPYPWEGLNEKTRGIRQGELVTFTAGSGIGKSAVIREIAYHLLMQGENIGMIMLEETVKRTGLGLMGIHANRPLHIDREGIDPGAFRAAYDATLGSGKVYLYDHFGSTDIDNLLSRVRYLAKALGCKWVFLDHLSIVVSGLGDGDERRMIDNAMTALRTLVQETGIGLILVSHLKRPEGKGHEDGAQTSLSQLRGSAAIAQLSDMVIGLERNQQGERPDVTTVRVLKNRFTGETGTAGFLGFDRETGRLYETADPEVGFDPETDEPPF